MMAFGTLRREPGKVMRKADYLQRLIEESKRLRETKELSVFLSTAPESVTKTWVASVLTTRILTLEASIKAAASSLASCEK